MTYTWFVGAVASVLLLAGPAAAQTPTAAQGVPEGELVLGTVRIPRAVLADGKPLPAGQYTLRLTPETAEAAPGLNPQLERWVEFVQKGEVRGRELATIIPAGEEKDTMEGPDMPGKMGRSGAKVEMLKGGDFLRVWIARNGNNYLLHLPPQPAK